MNKLEQAKWIFANEKGDIIDRYFDYRKYFQVDEIKDTRLYISVYSQYAVYINGVFVDCGQYADYEDWKVYDTLSVTEFLKEGKNEILIQQYVQGTDFATARKQIPGVIFSLVCEETTLCVSDSSCVVRENTRFLSKAEIITGELGFNFEYDATVSLEEYKPCIEIKKTANLYPRPIKKLIVEPLRKGKMISQGVFMEWNPEASKARRCQHAYFSNCERNALLKKVAEDSKSYSWQIPKEQNGDGAYFIFDMGGESAGLLSFDLEASEKCEVLISYGEHLDDLRVRSAVGDRNFTFRYKANKGRNTFFYPFQRFGLRYLQVMIYGQEGKIYHMGLHNTNYPLVYKPIAVTDGLHKEIWKTARKTLALCMHEHYEDCPWREQALYGMDGRIQMLCGYYAFEELEFPKASIRLMARSIKEDGLLELCPPGRVGVDIPSFSVIFVREVMEYIEYSGDITFAKEILPVLRKIVQSMENRIDESGLIPQLEGKWNFYEWQEGIDDVANLDALAAGHYIYSGIKYDCLLNAFVADAFRCFANLCKVAECDEDVHYELLCEQLCKRAEKAFWREEFDGYATYIEDAQPRHELTQALMLYAGAVPKHKQERVSALIKEKTLIPCTLSMTIFSYEALLKVSEENYDYVIRDIEEQWTRMLRSNTDTFWETQRGADDFDYAGSLCHGWAAVPIYIFAHYGKK